MYNSKRIAAKASVVDLQKTLTSQKSLSPHGDPEEGQTSLENESVAQQAASPSFGPPPDRNIIMPNRLTVSPRRMKVFHGHTIGGDNSVSLDLKANKLQIQVGQNLVRIKHNQRQDKSESIMNENRKMLQRLLETSPGCCDPLEISRRPRVLR